MTDHEHDLTSLGLWGALFGGGSAALRAAQTPMSWRAFFYRVGVGLVFSAGAAVGLGWQYPALPAEVIILASVGVGLVSLQVSVIAFGLVDSLLLKVDRDVRKRLGEDAPPKSEVAARADPAPADPAITAATIPIPRAADTCVLGFVLCDPVPGVRERPAAPADGRGRREVGGRAATD